ncbi:MAG: DMT family transporter [Candidatus Bathyarchaeia archaeon]
MDKAAIAEISAIFLWALGNVFIAHLSIFFDNFTQNFFRYISAAVLLLVFSLTFYRGRYLASLRYLKHLLALAAVVFLFQIFYVEGIVLASPTVGSLITRLSVVFVDLLSFLFFPEERALVRNTRFIIGTIVALIGVFGVVLSGSSLFHTSSEFLEGILSLFVASALWAVYTIILRVSLRKIDPLSTTTNTYLISGIMFAPLLATYGEFSKIFEVSTFVTLYLAFSGFISVGVGNLLNSYAIQRLGASLPANLQLLLPVFTGALSFIILNEPMPLEKLIASALTLLGCWLILSIRVNDKS